MKPVTEVKSAIGPKRPPESKQKRKRGAAIAALEGADLFLKGDWDVIEKFATCKLPTFLFDEKRPNLTFNSITPPDAD
jgi:hypothetical protein